MSDIGHNSKSFSTRWWHAVWNFPARNPYILALCALIYRYMDRDGSTVSLSDAQISDECGMGLTKAKQTKHDVIKHGLVRVIEVGKAKKYKSKIQATIPELGRHATT